MIKTIEENIFEYLYNLLDGGGFLNMTLKAETVRKRIMNFAT